MKYFVILLMFLTIFCEAAIADKEEKAAGQNSTQEQAKKPELQSKQENSDVAALAELERKFMEISAKLQELRQKVQAKIGPENTGQLDSRIQAIQDQYSGPNNFAYPNLPFSPNALDGFPVPNGYGDPNGYPSGYPNSDPNSGDYGSIPEHLNGLNPNFAGPSSLLPQNQNQNSNSFWAKLNPLNIGKGLYDHTRDFVQNPVTHLRNHGNDVFYHVNRGLNSLGQNLGRLNQAIPRPESIYNRLSTYGKGVSDLTKDIVQNPVRHLQDNAADFYYSTNRALSNGFGSNDYGQYYQQ